MKKIKIIVDVDEAYPVFCFREKNDDKSYCYEASISSKKLKEWQKIGEDYYAMQDEIAELIGYRD
jgi:hypothetical protein